MNESNSDRFQHIAELIVVIIGGPLLIWLRIWPLKLVMVLLAIVVLAAMFVVWRDRPPAAELGMGAGGHQTFWRCVAAGSAVWLLTIVGILVVQTLRGREAFPFLNKPWLLVFVTLFYSASAVAQEFLFRSFFFWRYKGLLPPLALAGINALAFGWIHIVYGSWFSVAVGTAGGVLFVWLYRRYRSMWGVALVHSLFGMTIFLMGYGRYFYSGVAGAWR